MNNILFEANIRGKNKRTQARVELTFVVLAPEDSTKEQILELIKKDYDLSEVNCLFMDMVLHYRKALPVRIL